MSLNNARLFNSDLVLIDVMLHFLNIKKKVCLIHQNFLVALTSLSYFKMRKKTNINILSVHKHFQYKSNTANITHKQYYWIVFINVHVQLRT